jgi:hypothetical protein
MQLERVINESRQHQAARISSDAKLAKMSDEVGQVLFHGLWM